MRRGHPQRFSERYRFHFLANEHEAPLYEACEPMLSDLHCARPAARGRHRQGAPRPGARARRHRAAAWFEATRCADEGFAKPHPGMLLMLLDITGVEPRRALMVGDTRTTSSSPQRRGRRRWRSPMGRTTRSSSRRGREGAAGSVAELHRWLVASA
jgi:phosphoglycolate phosphatase